MERNVCNYILKTSATVLICLLLYGLPAADFSKERELFDRGYNYCISNNPEKAIETFNLFLKEYPESTSRDAAMYWMGKSFLQMRSIIEARGIFSEIIKQYPNSPFIPHIEDDLRALGDRISQPRREAGADISANVKDYLLARLAAANSSLAQSGPEKKKLQDLLDQERNGAETRISNLKRQTEDLNRTIAELQTRLSEAQRTPSATEASNAEAERLRFQSLLDQERAGSEARIADFKRQTDELNRTIVDLQTRFSEAQRTPSSPEASNAEKERLRLQSLLDQERADSEAIISVLKLQANDLSGTVSELRERLEEAKKRADAAEFDLLDIEDQRNKLQALVDQERESCIVRTDGLKDRCNGMVKTIEELRTRLEEITRKSANDSVLPNQDDKR